MRDADILERLGELGLELPALPAPVASYVPVKRAGVLAFVAGQVAMVDGRLLHPGRLGNQVSVEMGQEAAARAGLQALSAIRDHLGGASIASSSSSRSRSTSPRTRISSNIPRSRTEPATRSSRCSARTGVTPVLPWGSPRSPWGPAWRLPSPPRWRRSRALRRTWVPEVALPTRDAPLIEPTEQGDRELPARPQGFSEGAHRDPRLARVGDDRLGAFDHRGEEH